MKKVQLILMLAAACMLSGQAFATERAYMAFDEVTQKMHLIVEADVPIWGLISFEHLPAACGLPERWDEESGEYVDGILIENQLNHWCELDLFVGELPIGEQVNVGAHIQLFTENFGQPIGQPLTVFDWAPVHTTNGLDLEYVNGCTPVLPASIPINSAFCATICHGTWIVPIECEDPNYTPELLEITVTNRCDPAQGSHCDNPNCAGVDWSLFSWNLRVFPGCLLYLVMTYCGQDEGCVCIWRSDFILPVEINGFSAVAGDRRVRLNWSTGSESELSEYRITRSESRDGVYVGIHEVAAANSATGANYSWVDESVVNGRTYYYKLHVEDINGDLSVYNLDGQTVVVEATPHSGAELPSEFNLAQNYPNPFNAQTSFSFTLPLASDVSLVVYDLLGREIATVVNGAMNAGVHTVNWSAEGLATGVYMYTLTAGEFSQSKKLLYLK